MQHLLVGAGSVAVGLVLTSVSPYIFVGLIGVGLAEAIVGAAQLCA